MEVHCSNHGLHLQSKDNLCLLSRTRMLDCKPISTPTIAGKRLSPYDGEPLAEIRECRSVVGALQNISRSQGLISFAVNHVCQFMHQRTTTH